MTNEFPAPVAPAFRRSRVSLTEQVGHDLLARIEEGALQPGDRLPTERELMAHYGVSRTVIREAMSSLRASGRLSTQQGRGAFIQAPAEPPLHLQAARIATLEDVLSLLEIRLALESEAASLAAQRRTPEQLAELQEVLQQFDPGDAERSAAADRQFHLTIARLSGNAHFARLLSGLSPHLLPRQRIHLFRNDPDGEAAYLQKLRLEHGQIADAIARGDAEGARAAMRVHLANSRERLRAMRETLSGPAS